MKIVYMGTPDFAVAPLNALIEAGYEITAVICQPDKAKGRSAEPVPCPVKEAALAHGLRVFQPTRIKRPEAVEELRGMEADIFVVAAFGQILSEEILEMPKYGCVNIHASLLPKYRGAAPIQWAVLNGEEKSGVSIMQMDVGIDTGDILLQKELLLAPDETGGSLFDRLAKLGAEAIVEALPLLEAGKLQPRKQDEALSSHVGMLTKEDGHINWSLGAAEIERRIRGLDPWPGCYTFFRGKQLKLWRAEVLRGSVGENRIAGGPGKIVSVSKEYFDVACGEGILRIRELQLEGKKRLSCAEFLRGMKPECGEILDGEGSER
ncbi:MAG: methionyl-tRNA formyltransferase [Lachnospiraceae bacterium]|nr:methionyl-tRNA formyltransferase [Lachnospiraceae bacterium]